MFDLHDPGSEKGQQGQSDANPILLEGVVSAEFDHLLSWMYPAL
jgi:hypothetical protein